MDTRPAPNPPMATEPESLTVETLMHKRIITCPSETPLRSVARMMATYRIHAVIVHDHRHDERDWAVVSDHDVVAAVAAGEFDELTASDSAATEFVTISPDETIDRAAQMLTEHDVAHLVVIDRVTNRPLGVLSTLDVAAGIAQ